MLCGPPGAGKSTYVRDHRRAGDCQVDIDLIPESLPIHTRYAIRKRLLLQAAMGEELGTCWFSTAAPKRHHRDYWRNFIQSAGGRLTKTLILLPPILTALERQRERDGPFSPTSLGIQQWYQKYEPPGLKEPHTLCVHME